MAVNHAAQASKYEGLRGYQRHAKRISFANSGKLKNVLVLAFALQVLQAAPIHHNMKIATIS